MRKTAGALLLLAVVGLCGCPHRPTDVDDIVLDTRNGPVVLEKVLAKLGVSATVKLEDVNGNGKMDYYIRYTGREARLTDELFGKVLGTVTVSIREVGRRSGYTVEVVYLELLGEVYTARMSDLYQCEQAGPGDQEVNCLLKAWSKVKGRQYGRFDPRPSVR
jgi:hypothetical protein